MFDIDTENASAWVISTGIVLFLASLALPSVILAGGAIVFGFQCFAFSAISMMSLAVSSHPGDRLYDLFISLDPVLMLLGWGMVANCMALFALLLHTNFPEGMKPLKTTLSATIFLVIAVIVVLPLSPYRQPGSLAAIAYGHVGFYVWLLSLAFIAVGSSPFLQLFFHHRASGRPATRLK